jgi:hypothetical protein
MSTGVKYSISVGGTDSVTNAFKKINAGAEALRKQNAKLLAPLQSITKELNKFGDLTGISKIGGAVRSLQGDIIGLAKSFGPALEGLTALTAAGSIAGLVKLTNSAAAYGRSLTLVSQALSQQHITPEKVQNYQQAGGLLGLSPETVNNSLTSLSDNLRLENIGQNMQGQQELRGLGLNSKALATDPNALKKILDAIANNSKLTPQQKKQIANDQGLGDWSPFLNDPKSLDAAFAQADQMPKLTEKQRQDDDELAKSELMLGVNFSALSQIIGSNFAPTLNKLVGKLNEFAIYLSNHQSIASFVSDIAIAGASLAGLSIGFKTLKFLFGGLFGPLGKLAKLLVRLALPTPTPAAKALQAGEGAAAAEGSAVAEGGTAAAEGAVAGASAAEGGGIVSVIRSIISGLVGTVKAAITGLSSGIGNIVRSLVSGLGSVVRSIVGGLSSAVGGTIRSLISGLGGALKSTVSVIRSLVAGIGGDAAIAGEAAEGAAVGGETIGGTAALIAAAATAAIPLLVTAGVIGTIAAAVWATKKYGSGVVASVTKITNNVVSGVEAEANKAYDAVTGKLSPAQTQVRSQLMNDFTKMGYSQTEAAGMAGWAGAESAYDPSATNGSAKGLFQWLTGAGDRGPLFNKMFGVDPDKATVDEQAKFVDYELKHDYASVKATMDQIDNTRGLTPEEKANKIGVQGEHDFEGPNSRTADAQAGNYAMKALAAELAAQLAPQVHVQVNGVPNAKVIAKATNAPKAIIRRPRTGYR